MFGPKNELLDSLDTFVDLMIEEVLPKHAAAFKSPEDSGIWKTLHEKKDDLAKSIRIHILFFFAKSYSIYYCYNLDSSAAMVFRLMQNILPYSRIKRTKPSDPKRRFYSVNESQDSFILTCATETEYKQKYDEKVNTESSVAPFMTLIGTLENYRYIMVDFDNITYKFHSLAKAIDICFKAYHLFNIEYPEKCEAMWDLINREFYNLPCTTTQTKPPTYMLLSEIKGLFKKYNQFIKNINEMHFFTAAKTARHAETFVG